MVWQVPGVQQVCVFRLQPGLLGSLRTLDLLAQKTSTRLLHGFFNVLLCSVPSDDINEKLEREASDSQTRLCPSEAVAGSCKLRVSPSAESSTFVGWRCRVSAEELLLWFQFGFCCCFFFSFNQGRGCGPGWCWQMSPRRDCPLPAPASGALRPPAGEQEAPGGQELFEGVPSF